MQETFLTLCRRVPDLPAQRLGAWLHRVLVNQCLDRLRRGKRWKQSELDEHVAPGESPQPGLGLDIERAVSRLPEKARLVFLLHDVEGLKHRELGELLGLSEGTSKSQLFRARRMLREFMDPLAGGAR